MAVIKNGSLIADTWRHAERREEIDDSTPLFVTLELWQEARDALIARKRPLGLRLRSEQSPDEVADDLGHFSAIALEFPKFTDGRAYSHARILRERHGYSGELRALGNVLRDQLLFMHRCGFDAFEFAAEEPVEVWLDALRSFSVWYQPTADGRAPVWSLRHRRTAA
jgi:uncharacterized protein (DUF934 family)